jgi:glutamate-1-semialdehyde 2,1-aminomutase
MKERDYGRLLSDLEEAYVRHSPKSRALNERAKQVMIDGGSHALRLLEPFPPRITEAHGAWLTDEDGHRLLDFWQGHLANILGHNPAPVTERLAEALGNGFGLQTGFTDRLQIETAEILCRQTGAERVRFTSSGTLATMYAILLARSFTGRELVLKIGGGWHGAQPWALKGIDYRPKNGNGFGQVESEGVPPALTDEVLVTTFNDPEMLRERFRERGDHIACLVMEPFLGVGGFLAVTPEYLRLARELTQQYGAVLILDEVIAGWRFRAGNMAGLYGVQPDLSTYGKIMGGGMPVAAVAGRADVLGLAGRAGGSRVKFSGGTYSAHPASMLAARVMMEYLVEHEVEIYPRLAALGETTRRAITAAIAEEGLPVRCTGRGNEAVPGSSLFMLHFPFDDAADLCRPEDLGNPRVCDLALSHHVFDLAMLLEDTFMLHSHGGLSTAHTEADIAFVAEACRRAARRIKTYL